MSSLFDILGSPPAPGKPPPPPPRSSPPISPSQVQVAFTPGRFPLLPPATSPSYPPPGMPPSLAPEPVLQDVAPASIEAPIPMIPSPQSAPISLQPAPQPSAIGGSTQKLSSPPMRQDYVHVLSIPPILAPMAASPSGAETPVDSSYQQQQASFASSPEPPNGSPGSSDTSGIGFNFPPSDVPSAYIVVTLPEGAGSQSPVSAPSGATSNGGAVTATSGPSGQVSP